MRLRHLEHHSWGCWGSSDPALYLSGSLQHGSCTIARLLTEQPTSPKGCGSREPGGCCTTFYNLASKVIQHHLCHNLDWGSYKGLPGFKRPEHRPHLSERECQYHILRRAGGMLLQSSYIWKKQPATTKNSWLTKPLKQSRNGPWKSHPFVTNKTPSAGELKRPFLLESLFDVPHFFHCPL